MAKTMTPSEDEITSGEIGKIQELLGAALRKSGLKNEPTQAMLKTRSKQLAADLVAVVQTHVDAAYNISSRIVNVNLKLVGKAALKATGRAIYYDDDVVAAMPKARTGKKEVFFFKPRPEAYKDGPLTDDALEKEYAFVGLKPCDPHTLAAHNAANPSFADDRPNGTHWQDADGNWCFATFDRWGVKRVVNVNSESSNSWRGNWVFAGVRK